MQAMTSVNRPPGDRSTGHDVDLLLKVIRTCASAAGRFTRLSGELLACAKYTKAYSSIRNIVSTSKLQGAIYTFMATDRLVVKAKACWRITKCTKKIVSSAIWFLNVAKDFGYIAAQTAAWTVYMGVIQVPFQLISCASSFWRMAKIYAIFREVNNQDHIQKGLLEYNVICCHQFISYLERAQDRLMLELQLRQPLVKSTSNLAVWLHSKSLEKQQMAIDQCEKALQTLKERAFTYVISQALACVSKVIDVAAAIFEVLNPAPLTVLSITATAFKISRHYYAKSQVSLQ